MLPLPTEPFFWRLGDTEMRRVSPIRFYVLGHVHRLRELKVKDSPERAFETISIIKAILHEFSDTDDFRKWLPSTAERAKTLEASLDAAIKHVLSAHGSAVSRSVVEEIDAQLTAFDASLEDDLRRLPTYYVEEVGAYSTDLLLSSAENTFPKDLLEQMPPQAIEDFRQAGKCLAFDAGTACAFHVFRATDAMLRAYCRHFNAVPSGNSRDWGTHIRELRNVLNGTAGKRPNVRTIELIDSIRAQDRNPLVHPELNLDADGALLMFDLCKSAISLMAMDIRNAP